MARSFSDSEKASIRSALIEKGRELFAEYGLKKTSVGELTKAAGIAQGSFYAFFPSKEELYFEILEMEENELARTLQQWIMDGKLTKDRFKDFVRRGFTLLFGNPFLENLIKNREYDRLMKKLPDEKRKKHLLNETRLVGDAIDHLRADGRIRDIEPEVLSGLFHALFVLHLHKNEIGEDVFPQIMELITDLLADRLIVEA